MLKPAISKRLAELDVISQIVINMPSTDPDTYKRLMGVKLSKKLIPNLKAAADFGLPLTICVNGVNTSKERTQDILTQMAKTSGRPITAITNFTHSRAGAIDSTENVASETWHGPLRGCRRVAEDITVTVEGQVILCCEDFHQEHVLGDLKTQSLSEILEGEHAHGYRRQIFGLDEADDDLICRNCAELWRPLETSALPETRLL